MDEPRRPRLSVVRNPAYGPRAALVEALLDRAVRMTRTELDALDAAERRSAVASSLAWDELRDRCHGTHPCRDRSLAARNAAWEVVRRRAAAMRVQVPADEGAYWRVEGMPGAGAARAVRYAACAIVAAPFLERETYQVLLAPWRSVMGHGRWDEAPVDDEP